MRELEGFLVVASMGTIMTGVFLWYSNSYEKLVDAGRTEMFATLAKTPMTEPCPGADGATCKTFGDYRLRQTSEHRWEVSQIEASGLRDFAVLDNQKIFVDNSVARNRIKGFTSDLIENVTGKKLADFHGKS